MERDFDVFAKAARTAFKEALAKPTGKSELDALLRFAEVVYYRQTEADLAQVTDALRSAESARDTAVAKAARAWRLHLEALVTFERAQKEIIAASPDGEFSSAPKDVAQQQLAVVLKACHAATAAAGQLPVRDRLFLTRMAALTNAEMYRMSQRPQDALKSLRPLTDMKPGRDDAGTPLLLTAQRLAAMIQYEEGSGKKPAQATASLLDRLETFSLHVRGRWSSHPTLAAVDFTIIEIAADAKLRERGQRALERLKPGLQSEDLPFAPMSLAERAFDLEDLAAARLWAIKALRNVASSADTSSDEWRDLVRATVTLKFGLGNPARQLLLLSALLREPEVLPKTSPARRWVLFALAKGRWPPTRPPALPVAAALRALRGRWRDARGSRDLEDRV